MNHDTVISNIGSKSFEKLRQINTHNAEYWSARDLQPLLGYSQWRRFENAVQKAMRSCEESGNKKEYHFAASGKTIPMPKGASKEVPDYHLSDAGGLLGDDSL